MAAPDSTYPSPTTRRLDDGNDPVEEFNLASDLWETLPEHLIELIVAKLPCFSSLVRFCTVCKGWKDLILSSKISPQCTSDHGRLFFFSIFDDEQLTIFNLSTATWETAPLQFLEKQFNLLDVVASAGGLLCFCTRVYGEFIVCNPITKCYKQLQMSCGKALTTSGDPGMPFPATCCDETGSLELLVGMVLDPNTRHFQLVVAGIFSNSRGTALVYDSNGNSWKKIADIPAGAHSCRLKPISCGRSIFFFLGYNFDGDRILKYDSEKQAWSWIPIPEVEGFSSTIIEHSGKIVLMTAPDEDLRMVELYELQDKGDPLWRPAQPLHLSRVCDAFPHIHLYDCLGQGDVMFLVFKRPCRTSGLEMGEIRVGFHNATTNLGVFSNWEDLGYEHDELPLCQIFKPSMLRIK